MINGYQLETELKTDNSGFSKWGFAVKGGERYFIKEFLAPVYPIYTDVLSKEQMENKRKICREYEQKMRLFYREINECSDGNIVKIEEFFRCGSKYYITTQQIPQMSWRQVCNLEQEKKIMLCRILIHSLVKLHERGIVHGDIKKNNVLFKWTEKGSVTAKLIDFDAGFWETAPPAPTEEIHGDMVYMAPETFRMMCEEEGRLTKAIDVYAMGLLFHEILVGKLPEFDRDKYEYPFETFLNGDTVRCEDMVPTGMKRMIANMLEPDPKKRITAERILQMFGAGKEEKTAERKAEQLISTMGRKSISVEEREEKTRENGKKNAFQKPGDL